MIEVLSFSGMYEEYGPGFFKDHRMFDLKGLSGTKLYIDPESEKEIRKITALSDAVVHLTDIGDYHYITRLYLHNMTEAFDLLVFDNHNDSQEPVIEGLKSCGSWIRDAIKELPDTLSGIKLVQGRDRITVLKGSFDRSRPLYISIDKDVLKAGVCPTNWDQGDMELSGIRDIILKEAFKRRIAGFDICGGVAGDGITDRREILKNEETDGFLIEVYEETVNDGQRTIHH